MLSIILCFLCITMGYALGIDNIDLDAPRAIDMIGLSQRIAKNVPEVVPPILHFLNVTIDVMNNPNVINGLEVVIQRAVKELVRGGVLTHEEFERDIARMRVDLTNAKFYVTLWQRIFSDPAKVHQFLHKPWPAEGVKLRKALEAEDTRTVVEMVSNKEFLPIFDAAQKHLKDMFAEATLDLARERLLALHSF